MWMNMFTVHQNSTAHANALFAIRDKSVCLSPLVLYQNDASYDRKIYTDKQPQDTIFCQTRVIQKFGMVHPKALTREGQKMVKKSCNEVTVSQGCY